MDKNLLYTLKSYFKAENIKVSDQELELQLFSHPHTPSLYAVTETLDFLKIENIAAKIDFEQLAELPEHFMAFIQGDDKGPYFAHVKKEASSLRVITESDKKQLSEKEFGSIWEGVVLLAEQDKQASSGSNQWIGLASIALVALSILTQWPNFFGIVFCMLSIAGLYISKEIFETTNERSSDFGQRVCGQESESGCKRVLKSSDYHFGPFSFNDLLFSFLVAGLALSIISLGTRDILLPIYGLSLLVVGATIFIQAFVIKAWCRLCLLSSTIIIAQFITLLLANGYDIALTTFPLSNLLIFALLFMVTLFVIFDLRTQKAAYYKLMSSEMELLRFKRSPKTIQRALRDTKEIPHASGADQLRFGNEDSDYTIRIVLSNTCGFCKDGFNRFHEYYQKKKDDFNFVITLNLFNGERTEENDAVAAMIQTYAIDKGLFLQMMKDWYEDMDLSKFTKKHTITFSEEDYDMIENHREWCVSNELYYTPALIINNRLAPDDYSISYLEDIIEALEADDL